MSCPVCKAETVSTTTYEDGSPTVTTYQCGSVYPDGGVLASTALCRGQLLSDLVVKGTGDAELDARVNTAAYGEVTK